MAPSVAAPYDDSSDALPQTFFLGRYRVVDEIGVGGMASVHLARVDGPGGFQKWIAIKRIHPHLVEDDQFVDMFLDEARIAAGINHANVAQVFDLGKDNNTYWIAMEYLHGEPLREMMRKADERGETIPPFLAARMCADAAEGLHAAHQLRGRNGQLLNLVHRDVTPHNLFVTYDGYTKVVDFGIAKVVDRLASTRAGTLKGKLAYMSPEQVRGQEVDRRTDIFALGVVLWELTTGRRLFRMDTDLDTLEKVQACVVPRPSTIVSGYPPQLEEVVMHALARRVEDRFQTGREFSRALQSFLMSQGTFIGPEDVGDYALKLFGARVAKREKYLEWAAEVTSTIDVDALHAKQAEVAHSPVPAAQSARPQPSAGAPPRSAGEQASAHRSEGQNSASASLMTSAPAAGQGSPSPQMASSSLLDDDEEIPTVVANREDFQAFADAARAKPPSPAAGMNSPAEDPGDELNATIALQADGPALEIRAAVNHLGQRGPTVPFPSEQRHFPPPGQAGGQAAQEAIETKMSMPRPAAVANWIAQQGELSLQGARSTAVLMAIAVLSTLCFIGIVALLFHRAYRVPEEAKAPTVSSATAGSGSANAGGRDDSKGKAGSDSRAGTASSSRTAARRSTTRQKRASGARAAKADAPGFLTVFCTPSCDRVVAAGQSLGPDPVVRRPLPPGQHRLSLRSGKVSKTLSIIVESDQLTSRRVTMK